MHPMPIGLVTMFAIYVICWWTVLFAVLPIGMNQQDQPPPTDGAQWGAPANPQLKRKFVTTTWVSILVWMVVMALVYVGWMPLPPLAPPV
jgi:predicted secreted protein